MMDRLGQKVQNWANHYAARDQLDRRDAIKRNELQLQFLGERLYHEYEPSLPPMERYWKRLDRWIECFPKSHQALAFSLAKEYGGSRNRDQLN